MNKLIVGFYVLVTTLTNLYGEWSVIIPSEFVYKVQSISCPDSNLCFALIDHPSTPVLYKSIDQGRTWELIYENDIKRYPALAEGTSPNKMSYFFIENTYSIIWKSIDSGYSFSSVELESGFIELSNLAMFNQKIGFVSNKSNFFVTTDGWKSNQKYEKLHPDQTFYSPIFLDSNIIGMTSYVQPPLDTHNHMTFIKYHLIENSWDTLYYFGAVYKNWLDAVENIFFVNDSIAYGCGHGVDFSLPNGDYFDIIYKSTNGGYNWELIHKELQHPEKGFYDIAFADENNGVAVGYWGKIAMTNDGGETWQYEPYPNDMSNCRKMLVTWAGKTPLIGTWDAGIFRYEGDFFKFPDDTMSVVEDYAKEGIEIYPNPAREYIEIRFKNVETGLRPVSMDFEIFDVLGRIDTPPCPLFLEGGTIRLDVSNLQPGVYFVRAGDEFMRFVKL